jgi:hypothetical protein
LKEKLKRKIKFTKRLKTRNKKKRIKLKKITNHNYGFKNEIKNKSNFDKRIKNKN